MPLARAAAAAGVVARIAYAGQLLAVPVRKPGSVPMLWPCPGSLIPT